MIDEEEFQPGFIQEGISYMAAKQSYDSFYINYPHLVEQKKHNQIINYELNYKDSKGTLFKKSIKINLGLLYNNVYME
ncbi:hypothetical protein LEP1GSC039_2881 [Leptospira santarosai str. 2000027870]|nr:hypothetical protein LEP1GSC039_2881 [Leptospira santarosai str. 2000027870]